MNMTKTATLTSIQATNNPDADRTYDYDELNRLIYAQGDYGVIGYTYDDVGNRITKTHNGVTNTYSYVTGTNRIDQITGESTINYTYDDNGNITGINDKVLIYNQNNRLIRVEKNSDVLGEYTYNGMGQRIVKTAYGFAVKIFHYDFEGNIIGESETSGKFLKEYLYMGDVRLAMVDVPDESVYMFINDNLGTPQALTDEEGNVVWQAYYKPFGKALINPNSSIVNNFRFKGQYYDSETGFHYNYYRYYNPQTGRYLRPDPIGLLGGINLFSYSVNNPINLNDSLGLTAVIISIKRTTETENSTIGDLAVNSSIKGYTLELPWNDNKRNVSRIKAGVYHGRLKKAKDSKFSYDTIEILNVKDRTDILFHRGNEPIDTEGCVLVGKTKSTDSIGLSEPMLTSIINLIKMTQAFDKTIGEQTDIIIKIQDPPNNN